MVRLGILNGQVAQLVDRIHSRLCCDEREDRKTAIETVTVKPSTKGIRLLWVQKQRNRKGAIKQWKFARSTQSISSEEWGNRNSVPNYSSRKTRSSHVPWLVYVTSFTTEAESEGVGLTDSFLKMTGRMLGRGDGVAGSSRVDTESGPGLEMGGGEDKTVLLSLGGLFVIVSATFSRSLSEEESPHACLSAVHCLWSFNYDSIGNGVCTTPCTFPIDELVL